MPSTGDGDSISAPKGVRSRSATRGDQWGAGGESSQQAKQAKCAARAGLPCLPNTKKHYDTGSS